MGKFSKIFVLVVICAALLSCTCATPLRVTEIQKTDKKLSCKDVILEINESEHYRELAKKEEGIHFGNMLMPVCWVSSYVDASKAVNAAQERVKYLGHIYDVLDCGGKSDNGERSEKAMSAPAAMAPFVAPPVIQIQPVPDSKIVSPQQVQSSPTVSAQSVKAGQCKTPEDTAKYTHQHTDRFSRVYTHCHFNTGPHRHVDD